jgi:hypothetical protein
MVEVEMSMEAWRRDSGTNEWGKFNYTEPIAIHNTSKHCVDDVNNKRHDPIGLLPNRSSLGRCSIS